MRFNVLFIILVFFAGAFSTSSCQKEESKSERFFSKVSKKDLTGEQKKELKLLVKKLVSGKKKLAKYDSKPWKIETIRTR